MNKYIAIILSIISILSLVGCGYNDTYEIEITIPAGSTETFVYSDEEISPTGNKITISSGKDLGDTEVVLKTIEVKEENAYESAYLTPGMPVKMDVEKGAWFKIGVSVQNETDTDKTVYVEVEGVEVRIADKSEVTFQATILEIKDTYYLVEPVEDSQELKSADQITIPIKNLDPSLDPKVGDIIEIAYNGEIAESYPAQITEVYGIKVVKEAEKWDLIPMVMVNGELYLDTGHESTAEARCGMMDGEITSEVDGSEKPTEDNQSNFGTGYGYQYGSQEGIIEIYMNDKWWVFATEKVLTSSELIIDPVAPVSIQNVFTGENANITESEDIRTIFNLLCGDLWNTEGTTDCASNIEITINGETYKYHSDCGTFNDNANQKYLSLDDETKNVVDALLAKYISLTSTEVLTE